MQVVNTCFTCFEGRCKSLIALVREAAAEIERYQKPLERIEAASTARTLSVRLRNRHEDPLPDPACHPPCESIRHSLESSPPNEPIPLARLQPRQSSQHGHRVQ